jgi:hypothetical protein
MSGGPSSAPSSRRQHAVEAFGNAASAIGPVTLGMSWFGLTRGEFSMLDAGQHVITEVVAASRRPVHASLWTWCISDYEQEPVSAWMANGLILTATLIIDRSAEQRSAPTIASWRSRFGMQSVKVIKNHAKICRVWNDEYHVLLRGSCNWNFNPRCEQMDITEGCPAFSLVARIEDELPILPPNCSNLEADTATSLGRAFEQSTLQMFRGVREWSIGPRTK